MIKWIVKKYALSFVNDALKKINEKTDIEKYRSKTQDVVWVFNHILDALKDNQISQEEYDKIILAVENLFK